MPASDTLRDGFIEWLIEEGSLPSNSDYIEVSLHTGHPGGDISENEVSDSSYWPAPSLISEWTSKSTGSFENASTIEFDPTGPNEWGRVTHFGIHFGDGVSTPIAYSSLKSPVEIGPYDDVVFPPGSLRGKF